MKASLLASTLAIASVVVTATPAAAAKFSFEPESLHGSNRAGILESIKTTYDTDTEEFFWSSTFTKNSQGAIADGGWLVVSPGDNPKGDAKEYVMFYLDGLEEKVSMYVYNGMNNSNSYKTNIYLGSTDLNVTGSEHERTYSFGLDMSKINNIDAPWVTEDWVGTAFEEQIGVWFHGAVGLETAYNEEDHSLETFTYTKQGWYDVGYQPTEKVPEPGLMLGLGVAAVAAKRLRRSA